MNELAKNTDNLTVKARAERIAKEAPALADLTTEQLDAVEKYATLLRYSDDFNKAVDLAGIDYQMEKERFLNTVSKTNSTHTRRSYLNALKKLEAYAEARHISPIELTHAIADDFINDLKKKDYSPATIRQTVASCSAFYSVLERRKNEGKILVINPFRGTKERPAKKAFLTCQYPTAREVRIITDSLPAEIGTIAYLAAFRGLRAGAFPGLEITGRGFTTTSKGKEIAGDFPVDCINKIHSLHGVADEKHPFKSWTANNIERNFRYYTEKLFKAGKIAAVYSIHDLRHFFAVTDYTAHKDIYRTSKLLNHSSIAVTEIYLRGLKILN